MPRLHKQASPAAKKNTKIKTPPAGGKKGAAAAPVEPPPEIPTKPSMTPGEAMEKQRKIQACMEYKQGLLLEGGRGMAPPYGTGMHV